jgi:DNA repair protein RadA/Sms
MAAVLERAGGIPLGRAELFGATSGGVRVHDPAADLSILAALASAATGVPVPPSTAFVGEVSLTGLVRTASGMPQRLAAADPAGCDLVVAGAPRGARSDPRIVPVRHVREALAWAAVGRPQTRRAAS